MSWIRFQDAGESVSGKTQLWCVVAKQGGDLLGSIYWYAPWRRYAFEPTRGMPVVFEEDCLREIADFCEARTREHKARRSSVTRGS